MLVYYICLILPYLGDKSGQPVHCNLYNLAVFMQQVVLIPDLAFDVAAFLGQPCHPEGRRVLPSFVGKF